MTAPKMSTLDDARAWNDAAVEAYSKGEWSKSAAAARIGLARAAQAEAEFAGIAAGVLPRPDLPTEGVTVRRVPTVREAFPSVLRTRTAEA